MSKGHEKRRILNPKRVAVFMIGSFAAVGSLGWAGLQVNPGPMPAPPVAAMTPKTTSLPEGLPTPVERFYHAVYGDSEIPVYEGVVISGRGDVRIGGVTLPVRFRFIHHAGQAYRHHIEVTWFGRTALTINETFIDGVARLEMPFGDSAGPMIDQGANLALWAEAIWMPAVWVTDPRVTWAPIDELSALLIVPFGDAEEEIIVFFDPETNLITTMESMRYQDADSTEKTLWINEIDAWSRLDGDLVPIRTAVTWNANGKPWAHFETESVILTAEISDYLRSNDY